MKKLKSWMCCRRFTTHLLAQRLMITIAAFITRIPNIYLNVTKKKKCYKNEYALKKFCNRCKKKNPKITRIVFE